VDIWITLRIWVDCILCLDYSIHASMSLLILNIMIYLKDLTNYKWHLPDNYTINLTIVAGKILLYDNNTLMLYLLHVLSYWYPIHWHYISCYTGILMLYLLHILSYCYTLLFMLFSDTIYIASSCCFFPLFICYHCIRYLYVML